MFKIDIKDYIKPNKTIDVEKAKTVTHLDALQEIEKELAKAIESGNQSRIHQLQLTLEGFKRALGNK